MCPCTSLLQAKGARSRHALITLLSKQHKLLIPTTLTCRYTAVTRPRPASSLQRRRRRSSCCRASSAK